MNQQLKAVKYILMTHDDHRSNRLHDTTFNLRVPFRPNSRGAYRVTLNEVLFNNTEALVEKDDYYQFTIDVEGQPTSKIFRYNVIKDLFIYNRNGSELGTVFQLLCDTASKRNDYIHDEIPDKWKLEYSLVKSDGTDYDGKSSGIETVFWMRIKRLTLDGRDVTKDITKATLQASENFCYLFNELFISKLPAEKDDEKPPSIADDDLKTGLFFQFYNMRLSGCYLYVINCPSIKTEVPTYNENNQGYSISALAYNLSDYHNAIIQGVSSMEGWTNDLSNFRIQLLNDQWNPVNLKSPIYVQITVDNAESP